MIKFRRGATEVKQAILEQFWIQIITHKADTREKWIK